MSRLSILTVLPPNKVTFWFTNNRAASYPLSHRYPHLRGASLPYRPLFAFVVSIPDREDYEGYTNFCNLDFPIHPRGKVIVLGQEVIKLCLDYTPLCD